MIDSPTQIDEPLTQRDLLWLRPLPKNLSEIGIFCFVSDDMQINEEGSSWLWWSGSED